MLVSERFDTQGTRLGSSPIGATSAADIISKIQQTMTPGLDPQSESGMPQIATNRMIVALDTNIPDTKKWRVAFTDADAVTYNMPSVVPTNDAANSAWTEVARTGGVPAGARVVTLNEFKKLVGDLTASDSNGEQGPVEKPWYKKPWIWGISGGTVVALGVGIWLLRR